MAKKVIKKKAAAKPAAKKTAAKKVPAKKPMIKKTAKKKVAQKAAPAPVATPARAPVKKVVSFTPAGKSVVEIIKPAVLPLEVKAPVEIKKPVIEVKKPVVVDTKKIEEVKSQQKVAWNSLPKYLPAQVRFLVQSSKTECEKAAGSPFPFAKFISSLPQTECGLEFAFLILNLEHSPESISDLCKLTPEQAQKIANNASTNFINKFSNECGDMFRKLKTQLTGSGIFVDTLTEQFLIQKVDKNFQTMLGAIILKSLGAKSLNYQPTAMAS